ncbi:hypothetical protein CLV43_11425 [Umezawaea tangerina]|uniref:Uncharacterized protein n=1 Tax=Umezawaea tangerina TaxID=84725 RepID=A0A2T0SNW7_9PSEU|nr:hypothetical protein CLV43_11425 [Umezawaea tangerina]
MALIARLLVAYKDTIRDVIHVLDERGLATLNVGGREVVPA